MKILRILLLLAFAGTLAIHSHATIVLSGDSNIAGELGTAGNATFFSNLLGGGSSVLVDSNQSSPFAGATHSFYNSLVGVSSVFGGLSAASLSGVDLFVGMVPAVAYSGSQITALADFISGGGTIFFVGENSLFPANNARINDALSALGSSMSIVADTLFDSNDHTTMDIESDALTIGVTAIDYAAPSVVAGGKALIRGTSEGQVFVAVERSGREEQPEGVPDSGSSLVFLGMGLAGFVFARRRR